jgi:hypothetical protein
MPLGTAQGHSKQRRKCMKVLSRFQAGFALGAILAGLVAMLLFLPLNGNDVAADDRRLNACDRLVDDLASMQATEEMYPFYLHSIGCSLDSGGVYVPTQDNGCAQTAYLLFITGSDVDIIHRILTGEGQCIHYEDGAYGPAADLEPTPGA